MVDKSLKTERIRLQEYGAPAIFSCEDIDVQLVKEANRRWSDELGLASEPIRIEELRNGRVKLRAERVTGVVRLGETDIEISPKFLEPNGRNWQIVLWQILNVVEGGLIDDFEVAADRIDFLSIPDLLAELFLASYAKGTVRGLPRSYMGYQGVGSMLRGSFDSSRIDEWIAQPWNLPFESDVLTENTALTRLLNWAAATLAATVKSPSRLHRLREILAQLSHVGRIPPHLLDAQQIHLGTQHRALESAKMVAVLLLEGGGIHHGRGSEALSGFLWKSDEIYENFIFWLCNRAANRIGLRIDKRTIKLGSLVQGEGMALVTTPDVVIRDLEDNPIAIMDAKYKRLGGRPKSSDTYQVLAAAHALGCSQAGLVYPASSDRGKTVWEVPSNVDGSEIRLTALPINLMALLQKDGSSQLVDTIQRWLLQACR
ncbi:MAG TPA: hypothetical protein DIS84_03565 [Corynebacterium stationis]|jgi:5-methylcytosine-specific restriction endonuclease McrBC regulatory subunit McrC|nr:hypothetical protein [Corynebacterium stationis]